MKLSIKKGLSFGLTSGVITTLGLIIGLFSSTHSKTVILSGILVIAIADSLSDALGIHISEESEKGNSSKHIWESTFATFISKFIIALSFIIPILFFNLSLAIIINIIWGIFLIAFFSYYIATTKKTNPLHSIAEHVLIAIVVIIATHYIGILINSINI